MNLSFETNRPRERKTTQAAEGLPRLRFTVAEVEAMVVAGLMDEDERVELIGGELVPMLPKSIGHEVLKTKLNDRMGAATARRRAIHTRNHLQAFGRHLSGAGLHLLRGERRAQGPERRQRASGGGDRGFELRLRHRAEGGALRILWHPRAMGDPCGAA